MEYRVGGASDLNSNGGWLKIKTWKYEKQTFIQVYLGDDGSWEDEPILSFDSHWISEIVFGLQKIEKFLENK